MFKLQRWKIINPIAMVQKVLTLLERQIFGVCSWWGDKLRIKTANVRLFFIYASFLTFLSPFIVYLVMAFVLNLKNYIQTKRSSVWDL
jgi:phage shock protein C